jgi:hypothetical protein
MLTSLAVVLTRQRLSQVCGKQQRNKEKDSTLDGSVGQHTRIEGQWHPVDTAAPGGRADEPSV